MIYSLEGIVSLKRANFAVINVNGVGYRVYFTSKDLNSLSLGKSVFVYTHYLSTDTQTSLFGFLYEESLELFLLLTGVSGVGPRIAFTILDSAPLSEITEAISNAESSFFKKVKGVGPKLALKIIVEMQDKVGKIKELNLSPLSQVDEEILQALCNLGFSSKIAREALESLDSNLSEEEKLKQAIKFISKNAR
ncbi:MAG TPA: Holliday junction branch migration protein RuvA [candidate division WWE3 bacterium]|uniref:Holliday junction branch migration complex subunit RuvA n=1 Tax=candidate division WWE3 bacterium TaxID=2053526 RepID=A0A7V5MIL5_UNCKA|nr:Holliday junction branch migration protein RuvA [candidate division WWE3 bacterium]